ncbi:hypothetical protein BJV77DRAFT_1086614 [Russula vinacea]|nr:hypothetical protein BJV77DRAFT_1086614 [Russula vinacea]
MPRGNYSDLFRSQLARRNAPMPIFFLPAMVLARIFHFPVFKDPACSAEQNLGWIRATHVCRFWNQGCARRFIVKGRNLGHPGKHRARARNARCWKVPALGHFDLREYSGFPSSPLSSSGILVGKIVQRVFTTDNPSGRDLNQFIDLLLNCSGLKTLALGRYLLSQLAQFSHGQTIHLPRLSRLCLGPSYQITNLMRILKLRSSTRLHDHFLHSKAASAKTLKAAELGNCTDFLERARDKQPRVGPHYSKGHSRRKGKKKRYDDSAQARSTGAPADAPIFPKLTFLVLNSLDFCEGPLPSGVLFYVVERGLHQRKAASKAPLKVLRADNCVISAKRAKALQKLVQQFGTTGTGMSLRFPGLF